MSNFNLDDLADSANDSTGNFLRDVANQAANFACGIYKNYPQWTIDPLNTATGISNPIAQFQKSLWDKLCSPSGRPGLPAPPKPLLFTGGQCPVAYLVKYSSVTLNHPNVASGVEFTVRQEVLPGPISNFTYDYRSDGVGYRAEVDHRDGHYNFPQDGSGRGWLRLGSVSVTRIDEQPDNCGDEPGQTSYTFPPPEALTQNITINQGDTNISFPVTFNSSTTINIPIKVVGTDPSSGNNFTINFGFDGVDFNFEGETTPDSENIDDIKNTTDETNNTTKETNNKVTEAAEDIKKLVEALELNLAGAINVQPCGKAVVEYKYSGKTFLGLQAQINSLANMLARVHEDICLIQLKEPLESDESELLSRIYQILGGNTWFNNTQTPLIKTKGEEAIKNFGTAIFGENTDQLNQVNCTNLIDLLAINTAVNYYRLGLQELPATLPESLISKDEGFIGNLIPNPDATIYNYIKLFGWYVERYDELMGQWELAIEVKDTDPSTPGEQPKGIKLPNLAEATAEIFLLAFQAYSNTEILLNLLTRNLIETGTDKQQNFITYKLLQSLTDWVGFKQKDISLEMPLTFSPEKTRYDEIMQESKVKVNCVEFDEKFGLEADFMRFREAVAILQAQYKRKLDPNGDIQAQILKYILDTFRGVNKVNGEDENLEEFFNQVENGFTDIPSVGDPTQPYGRPYEQRPKIRDLSQLDVDEQT